MVTDMVGRPVEIGDLVVCTRRKHLVFGRVTKYNPKTRMLSVKPIPDKNGNQEFGFAFGYYRDTILLVRDYEWVTS